MVRLLSWRFDRQVPFINLDAPLLFLGLSHCVPHLIVVVGDSLGFRCREKCGDSMHVQALPATSIHNHFRV